MMYNERIECRGYPEDGEKDVSNRAGIYDEMSLREDSATRV